MDASSEPLGRSSTTLSGCVTEWSAHALGGVAVGAMGRTYETPVSPQGLACFVSVNSDLRDDGPAGAEDGVVT